MNNDIAEKFLNQCYERLKEGKDVKIDFKKDVNGKLYKRLILEGKDVIMEETVPSHQMETPKMASEIEDVKYLYPDDYTKDHQLTYSKINQNVDLYMDKQMSRALKEGYKTQIRVPICVLTHGSDYESITITSDKTIEFSDNGFTGPVKGYTGKLGILNGPSIWMPEDMIIANCPYGKEGDILRVASQFEDVSEFVYNQNVLIENIDIQRLSRMKEIEAMYEGFHRDKDKTALENFQKYYKNVYKKSYINDVYVWVIDISIINQEM